MLAVRAADLPRVAPAISQIVKMHDAGVSEDVMLAYVQNAAVPKPNADELIYLHEAGVSKTVLTSLLSRRDAAPQTQVAASEPGASANSEQILAKPEYAKPAASSGPTIVMQQQPQPASSTVVVHSAPSQVALTPPPLETYYMGGYGYYPGYSYYPYYSRPFYGPTFSIGFGFGSHFGGGHHWGGHNWGHHGGWHGGGHWHR